MIATLAKRARALEASFWAKAERMRIPVDDKCVELYLSVWPLGDVIYDRWLKRDSEAMNMYRRMGRIEEAELPVHLAFLPDRNDLYRRAQWALYRRADYRKLYMRLWERMLIEVAPLYDVKAVGLVGVALRLFEKEIDEWMAGHEYAGYRESSEILACNQIELSRISERIRRAAGYPEDQKTREELWQRALLEYIDHCSGRKTTEEDLVLDRRMGDRLGEDMATGRPASESQAASYFRELHERYPRKSGLRTYPPGFKW